MIEPDEKDFTQQFLFFFGENKRFIPKSTMIQSGIFETKDIYQINKWGKQEK